VAQRIRLQVEDGDEEAEVREEASGTVAAVCQLAERARFEEGAHLSGLSARTHDDDGEQAQREGDEANDAAGPAEANSAHEALEQERVWDAAEAGAGRSDADRQRTAAVKVLGQKGQAGHGQASGPKADAEALWEEDMPVLRRDAVEHEASADEDGSQADEDAEVACVEGSARDKTDYQQEKGLDRANPGDSVRAGRLEALNLVVRLEDTIGVDKAPGDAISASRRIEVRDK